VQSARVCKCALLGCLPESARVCFLKQHHKTHCVWASNSAVVTLAGLTRGRVPRLERQNVDLQYRLRHIRRLASYCCHHFARTRSDNAIITNCNCAPTLHHMDISRCTCSRHPRYHSLICVPPPSFLCWCHGVCVWVQLLRVVDNIVCLKCVCEQGVCGFSFFVPPTSNPHGGLRGTFVVPTTERATTQCRQ
jgi:hypothetical protein